MHTCTCMAINDLALPLIFSKKVPPIISKDTALNVYMHYITCNSACEMKKKNCTMSFMWCRIYAQGKSKI